MKDEWDKSDFAKKWDTDTAKGNPARPEQLDILTSILSNNYIQDHFILDVGSGSGQVEELLFNLKKEIKVVGLDSSNPMIELAKQRLSEYSENFQIVGKDIGELEPDDLPSGKYCSSFAVQVLHELDNAKKLELIKKIHSILEPGGIFLIVDRVKTEYTQLQRIYESVWNRLENLTELKSGKSYEEYKARMESKDDFPVTAGEYAKIMQEGGFSAAVIHLHLDRALIGGVRS